MTTIPRIISADDHVVEPPNVWTDRLPAKYRDVGPRVRRAPVAEMTFVGGTYSHRMGDSGPLADWWLYEDRAVRILPLTDVEAEEVIRAVKGAPLFFGFGGSEPVDVEALAQLLLRVSALASDLPEISALSLGPVLVSPAGAVVVDARVAVAPYRPMPELALRRLH